MKNYLFTAFTKKPRNPLSIIIKEHDTKDVLYVTYSNGPQNGGGSWGEDLRQLNDRTVNMIKESFSAEVFEKFKNTVLERNAFRLTQTET
jgi:hypothetical protein